MIILMSYISCKKPCVFFDLTVSLVIWPLLKFIIVFSFCINQAQSTQDRTINSTYAILLRHFIMSPALVISTQNNMN